jgi:hypothetical protein
MTSEHNHMYDGLHQAAQWRDEHRGFLALYGQEWGVISHGGHINILNADALLGWERNAQGDLLADEETPKSDYQRLYSRLRERGWVGQFNHPQQGQFSINGQPLAWTADGDASMLLCEVMNSSAYSNRTAVLLPRSTVLTPASLRDQHPWSQRHRRHSGHARQTFLNTITRRTLPLRESHAR